MTETVGKIAAGDFERLGQASTDEVKDIGAIRPVEEQVILLHENTMLDRISLQARAANLDSRPFLASKRGTAGRSYFVAATLKHILSRDAFG